MSLKHHLREERGPYYDDLYPLICHLPRHFHTHDIRPPKPGDLMEDGGKGHYSPFTMLERRSFVDSKSKPREIPSTLYLHDRRDLSCQGTLIQGNLPLEITNYISAFFELCIEENRLITSLFTNTLQQVSTMLDVLTTCERILRTPLPLAYNIAISQTGVCLRFVTNHSVGLRGVASLPTHRSIRMGVDSCFHGYSIHPLWPSSYLLRG